MKGIYLVGGYPDRAAFRERLAAIEELGFDFVEIGLPFSDPVADGPVIAGAMHQVLETGITVDDILEDIGKVPVNGADRYLMTYANVVYRYGAKQLGEKLNGGVRGVILPDVPVRMQRQMVQLGLTLPQVPFVTPESREEDLAVIAGQTPPFVYFIGVRGITGGAATPGSPAVRRQVEAIRRHTTAPVVLGFGIRTPQQAAEALATADGFVIGTAAVEKQHESNAYRRYLEEIAKV